MADNVGPTHSTWKKTVEKRKIFRPVFSAGDTIQCGAVEGSEEATRNRQMSDSRWSSWFIGCADVHRYRIVRHGADRFNNNSRNPVSTNR
jgi:hypothetical protein